MGTGRGDLITGASNRSAIGTLVERVSRFTILLYLPGDHGAEAVRDAGIDALGALPPRMRRSLTWDQGSEMALQSEIVRALDMPLFFCKKASPWQRPSNENTNGLLRHYFPRKPTYACTTPTRSPPSPTNSTHGRARPWTGIPPPPRLAQVGPDATHQRR